MENFPQRKINMQWPCRTLWRSRRQKGNVFWSGWSVESFEKQLFIVYVAGKYLWSSLTIIGCMDYRTPERIWAISCIVLHYRYWSYSNLRINLWTQRLKFGVDHRPKRLRRRIGRYFLWFTFKIYNYIQEKTVL